MAPLKRDVKPHLKKDLKEGKKKLKMLTENRNA